MTWARELRATRGKNALMFAIAVRLIDGEQDQLDMNVVCATRRLSGSIREGQALCVASPSSVTFKRSGWQVQLLWRLQKGGHGRQNAAGVADPTELPPLHSRHGPCMVAADQYRYPTVEFLSAVAFVKGAGLQDPSAFTSTTIQAQNSIITNASGPTSCKSVLMIY